MGFWDGIATIVVSLYLLIAVLGSLRYLINCLWTFTHPTWEDCPFWPRDVFANFYSICVALFSVQLQPQPSITNGYVRASPRTGNTTPTILGLDCEMVGIGEDGKRHALARVSLVDFSGRVVYDSYVKSTVPVTDYRTFVSGIEAQHLERAPSFSKVRAAVEQLISGATLVGHGLDNDLKILRLEHPVQHCRDTAYYWQFRELLKISRCPPLKQLVETVLGDKQFQNGAHDPVEDAYAPLRIYKKYREDWDRDVCRQEWS
ncbi:unnamed protein product, partial [Mesorhabditis spiculigera]